jgi:crotonobetainyl-CoA:carnitine CoA-transferase CaiB-like acyl-CoA transferase
MANQAMNQLYGAPPRRLGNGHPNVVPYQDFPTADGDVIIAVGNDGQFARLCGVLGHAEWATDARFATNQARQANRVELIRLLRTETLRRSTADWVAAMEAAEVPCGPINTLAQVFADPQVQARGMCVQVEHPTAGSIPLVANPIKLSATPVDYRHAPPTLGQDTDAVLRETLGLDAARIAALRTTKVI